MKLRLQKIAFVLAVLGIGACGSYLLHTVFKAPPKQQKLDSIVRLVDEEGMTFCTGTVIQNNMILTAAHCTGIVPIIEVRAKDNIPRGVAALALFATGQMDQAVLTGDFSLFNTTEYITDPNKLQKHKTKKSKFISCGYPFNGGLFCTEMEYVRPDNFAWAVRGLLIPGMSGGPTMLPDGTVVAVNVAVEGELSIVTPIYNLINRMRRD